MRQTLDYFIDGIALLIVTEYFLFFVGISHVNPTFVTVFDYLFIGILILDFILRYREAQEGRAFLKDNWPEVVSFIPTIRLFRAFRIFRIIKKSRVKGFFTTVHQMLKHNSLYYVILVVNLLAVVGGGLLYRLENDITSLKDGIWFSFVTMTTVGYGDYTPVTSQGRIIALVMMIIGIGFLGVLTGSIASFFTARTKRKLNKDVGLSLGDISPEEENKLLEYLQFIRRQD